jgi:hypothetical protein
MPLIEFNCILGDIGAHCSSSVAMSPVCVWKLRWVVNAVWLHEALDVSHWLMDSILDFVHK